MRKAGTPAELERQRMIAANLFDQGKPPAEVAAALEVDDQTVRRWRRAYTAGGRGALRAKRHPGSAARLTDADRAKLAGLLVTGPAACGYPDRYLWTAALAADLIGREFGVRYHADYAGTLMRAMRFTPQKPARRAAERDDAKVAAWRETYWPDLVKKVPTRTASSCSLTRSAS